MVHAHPKVGRPLERLVSGQDDRLMGGCAGPVPAVFSGPVDLHVRSRRLGDEFDAGAVIDEDRQSAGELSEVDLGGDAVGVDRLPAT